MNIKKKVKKLKRLLRNLYRRNPIEIKKQDGAVVVKHEDQSFDPTKEEHTRRNYLVRVDGQDATAEEWERQPDDMALEKDNKQCAITSKPLMIDGNHFYFTKSGFLGTMALNEDTLLGGDVYDPTKETYERRIPVSGIDESQYPDIDFNDLETEEIDGEKYYIYNTEDDGDISLLHGSKRTLAEMNKAKRMRKLLKPQSIDRSKLLLTLGSGVAIGYMLYPQLQD